MSEGAPIEHHSPSMSHGIDATDIAVAVRNAMKLGLSLIATWGLALVVRIQLPRHLGPIAFGNFNFADSFSAAFFVFIGFGLETYVQKEVSVRPEHASDFFGGAVVVRTIASVALFGMMAATLVLTHRPPKLFGLVLICAIAQYLMNLGQLLSSMLRASTNVGVLATVNVVSKLLWASGIAAGIYLDAPLVVLALPALLGEVLRCVVLWRAAQTSVGLRWRIDRVATTRVLISSLPYFAASIAVTLVNRLDVSMLEFMSPGPEVGWYSAASNLGSLAMFLSPLIWWVLMPLLARAKHRSSQEFYLILRRVLEAFLVAAIPVTLIIALGAEFWVRLAFGAAFAPAALSLQVLAPMFVATYACVVLAIGIMLMDRPWVVTGVSICGIMLQPILTFSANRVIGRLGMGCAGASAALGVVGMEVFQMCVFLWFLRRHAIDRRNFSAVGKSALIALAIVPLDHFLKPLGPVRLVIDLVAFVGIALLVRVERLHDIGYAISVIRARGKGDTTLLA
jgi:O-antigen/teichoic acid export membrane protein